jgi:transposase
MHQIAEILRLRHAAHLSQHQIARALQLSAGVVNKYLAAAQAAGLSWPLPEDLRSETALRQRLFPSPAEAPALSKVLPDYAYVHQELKRKGVTRQLLWEEYCAAQPEQHYGYTQFCVYYQAWLERLSVTLRQTHRAGEKLFVDYAGPTVPVVDPETGEVRDAAIFVAVLGASNYTFAEATFTQSLPDWCGSHVRAFEFFEGVPELVIPDNLKAAVSKACRYEPLLNRTYQELLEHYGTAALPARPYNPRDKAKAEAGVLLVERWILARLRQRTFFSLAELNQAIRELLTRLNAKPFKKLPGSRRTQFEQLDRPALRPLPPQRYQFAEWKKARVHLDSHVEVAGHYYSVPHQLLRQELDVRLSAFTVECFYQQARVTVHARSDRRGGHTTVAAHLPSHHQAQQAWSPGRFLNWAVQIGPATRDLVRAVLAAYPHPEMAYRSCLGLLTLAKRFSPARLEQACRRALALGSPTRRSVLSILEKNLDAQPLPPPDPVATTAPPAHANVRGAAYYQALLSHEGENTDAQSTDARALTRPQTARHGAGLPTPTGTSADPTTPL